MAERPILFSDTMVRAILAGAKTQTRRVVQAPAKNMQRAGTQVIKHRAAGDPWYGDHVWSMRNRMGVWGDYTHERFMSRCPYGAPGDRLWVREAWAPFVGPDGRDYVAYRSTCAPDGSFLWGGDGEIAQMQIHRWRPSIHMPRWASHLTLEIVDVRVERVQSITEDDARAEGVSPEPSAVLADSPVGLTAREAFAALWDSINGKRPGCSWADDPWVWAVTFRRVEVRR